MHYAAETGNEYVLLYLIRKLQLPSEVVDNDQVTPLHLAIQYKHLESAVILMRNSNNLMSSDREGLTPLHYAVYIQDYKITRQLIMNNASRDSRDIDGDTPLQLARKGGDRKIISLLVRDI